MLGRRRPQDGDRRAAPRRRRSRRPPARPGPAGLTRSREPAVDGSRATGVVGEGPIRRSPFAAAGFRPVAEFLEDESTTEVLINGPGAVWVEQQGTLLRSARSVGAHDIELLIEQLLTPLGLRVDRSAPIVDARLPDGSRVNIVVPPLAIDGPCVSIRRFPSVAPPLSAFGPAGLVDALAELVGRRASMLVVGPTSTGKTTLMSSLGSMVDESERVVCIEDTAELRLRGPQIVRLEARPANSEGVGEVTLRRLVLTALRMRPDRIVVGEVRGSEAFDLLLALTSGHRGSIASCHAADAGAGLRRLETLAVMAGTGLPTAQVRRMIVDGLDTVITMGRVGGSRLVRSIHRLDDRGLQPVWEATTAAGARMSTPAGPDTTTGSGPAAAPTSRVSPARAAEPGTVIAPGSGSATRRQPAAGAAAGVAGREPLPDEPPRSGWPS